MASEWVARGCRCGDRGSQAWRRFAATGDGVISSQRSAGSAGGRRDRCFTKCRACASARSRARSITRDFAIGTAYGVDDQEGRALSIEEAAGFPTGLGDASSVAPRCRRRTLRRAHWIEVVEVLVGLGATMAEAVGITARVQRGGCGSGVCSRESSILPAYLR